MTALWLWLWACSAPVPEPPPSEPAPVPRSTGRPETHRAMVEDLAAVRSPSDGGGAVERISGPTSLVAGTSGSWELVFRAGPLGVADGGSVIFQAPAFWGWDPPQLEWAEGPGFTTVHSDASGVRLSPAVVDQGMLRIGIEGRALTEGERIAVHYGAGPQGARADRFAESESELWFAVDGDGDGVRALVAEPVRVATTAGPPDRLLLTVPSAVAPGERFLIRLALIDARGNAARVDGSARIEGGDLALPEEVSLRDGVARVEAVAGAMGVYALTATSGSFAAVSNPMVVREGAQPILWADLQIHTGRSDGTGTPAEVWRYAREVAGLDVAAITDHDHWGMRFLDATPELWSESVQAARAANDPGSFVAIPAYEWTNWVYGHRHVLWFEPDPPLLSSFDPATDDPAKLWAALKGRRALTIAHHSAGGPVAVDWSFRPPPELEPVTEIVSVHGQSESAESAVPVHPAVAGNFVLDQLRDGLQVGFIGSTDGHDGHPGMAQLNGPSGGLAALVGAERTRESVYATLREGRVYATNGVRTILRFGVQGTEADLRVVATDTIVRVEEVRKAGSRVLVDAPGSAVLHHHWTIADVEPGDFVYVRVIQADGGRAWSSPHYF